MKHVFITFLVIVFGLSAGAAGSYVGFTILSEANESAQGAVEFVAEKVEPTEVISPDVDRPLGGMGGGLAAEDSEGKLISGAENAPYQLFSSELYEEALADGKVIVLYFCSDVDPICMVEAPDIAEGFDKLTITNVVGFYVHNKQEILTDYEKELVRKFDIDSPHTKVVLVDGDVELQSSEAWSTPRFVEAVSEVVTND